MIKVCKNALRSYGVISEFNRRKTRTDVGENDSKKDRSDAPGVIEKRVLAQIQLKRRIKRIYE
jgi:hypothetical protein